MPEPTAAEPKQCLLFELTSNGTTYAGRVILTGDKISVAAAAGNEVWLRKIMVSAEGQDPAKWFASLPDTWNGTYTRAEILL